MRLKFVWVIGLLLILVGAGLIGMYIVQVWQVLKASDQSIIFWYLPMAFLGMIAIMMGIMSMAWVKRQHLKAQTRNNSTRNGINDDTAT